MMPKLQRLRTNAFHAQHGRCCYCGLPMWNASPDELKAIGLSPRTSAPLRCTAEHLVAQQDGGKDVTGNIAAACWLCNTRRHKRKSPPAASEYKVFVRKRMHKGKWHCESVLRAMSKVVYQSHAHPRTRTPSPPAARPTGLLGHAGAAAS